MRTAVTVVSINLSHLSSFPCKTADSPADLADSRRQKTGWANGSAKADAADLADKDNYHIVEILLFMLFAVSLRPLRYLRENNMQEDSSYL